MRLIQAAVKGPREARRRAATVGAIQVSPERDIAAGAARRGEAKGRMKQIVLRAYQLARSGTCASLGDIEEHLKSEGFHPVSIQEYLAGQALRADLTTLCEQGKRQRNGR